MTKINYKLSPVFISILITGLICSTIHLEVAGAHALPSSDAEHTIVENHNYCAVCAITFKSEVPVVEREHIVPLYGESDDLFIYRFADNRIIVAKHGRAPPFGG